MSGSCACEMIMTCGGVTSPSRHVSRRSQDRRRNHDRLPLIVSASRLLDAIAMKHIITAILSVNLLACVSSAPEDALRSTASELDSSHLADEADWRDLPLIEDPSELGMSGCFKASGFWTCCSGGDDWQICCTSNACY